MAHAHGPLQQQQVLWEGTLEHQQYGELTAEVGFAAMLHVLSNWVVCAGQALAVLSRNQEGCPDCTSLLCLPKQATFAQPVLVTGIRGTAGSLEGFLQLLPQLVKGFAKDLHIPTAARFGLLFNAVSVTQQETQEWRVDEVRCSWVLHQVSLLKESVSIHHCIRVLQAPQVLAKAT